MGRSVPSVRNVPPHYTMHWQYSSDIVPFNYQCGYCGREVGSNAGYYTEDYTESHIGCCIYICPSCGKPTYTEHQITQVPGVPYGRWIPHLPQDIGSLYAEARNCCSVNAFTAAVLCCRKLLLNVAVERGAPPNLKFVQYVNFLVDNHHVPPSTQSWVDKIRDKGNEATHEIVLMEKEDAKNIISFAEMLLALIYDYPNR